MSAGGLTSSIGGEPIGTRWPRRSCFVVKYRTLRVCAAVGSPTTRRTWIPASASARAFSGLLDSRRADRTPSARRHAAASANVRRSSGEPEVLIRLQRVETAILQHVRSQLVGETDPRPSWPVEYTSTPRPSAAIARCAWRSWTPQSHRSDPSASPVRHSECRRTKMSSPSPMAPRHRQRWTEPSQSNARVCHSPKGVGSVSSATSVGRPSSRTCIRRLSRHVVLSTAARITGAPVG